MVNGPVQNTLVLLVYSLLEAQLLDAVSVGLEGTFELEKFFVGGLPIKSHIGCFLPHVGELLHHVVLLIHHLAAHLRKAAVEADVGPLVEISGRKVL